MPNKRDPKRMLPFQPELLYETEEEKLPIPFCQIPPNKDDPPMFFVHVYRDTGEVEPSDTGAPEPIMDGPYPKMYVDFEVMLDAVCEQFPDVNINELRDKVRVGMGLKPAQKAKFDGERLLEKVLDKEPELKIKARDTAQDRAEKFKKELAKEAKN